jgi:hypothetical protein
MGDFLDMTLTRVPPGFEFGEPLRLLFAWVEEQGFVTVGADGELYGTLGAGTTVVLRGFSAVQTAEYERSWTGTDRRLGIWPFVRTGFDGSYGALWADQHGATRIVHLGSGSGSLMTCVLAEDPVDFLRLMAIGYDELAWPEEWTEPPEPQLDNLPYQEWVCSTFGVSIPRTAIELVPHPAEMGDESTSDPFCQLINTL